MKVTLCPIKTNCNRVKNTTIYCNCSRLTNLEDSGIYTVTQKEIIQNKGCETGSIKRVRLWPKETKITRTVKGEFILEFKGVISFWKPSICDIILRSENKLGSVLFVPANFEYRI